MAEVDLGGEEGRRADALVARGGHVGEADREDRPADAIAHGVDAVGTGGAERHVHRLDDPGLHVVLEACPGVPLVRIDPRDDEDRVPLLDAPADERFLRGEVEDVELVDPRRHDDQRSRQHLLRRRVVADDLAQVVLVDHLARCCGEVLAETEVAGAGLADAQVAAAGLDVLGEHVHAPHEVLGVGREGLAEQFRVGHDEVGRRQRVRDLPDVEGRLAACMRVEPARLVREIAGPSAGDQVGLPDEVEELVVAPVGIGKAPVARIGLDGRRRGLSQHPFHRRRPEVEIARPEPALRLEGALGVRHPVLADPGQDLDDVAEPVSQIEGRLPLLARLEVGGGRLADLLHDARQVPGKHLRVLHRVGMVLDTLGRHSLLCDRSATTARVFDIIEGDSRQ